MRQLFSKQDQVFMVDHKLNRSQQHHTVEKKKKKKSTSQHEFLYTGMSYGGHVK